MITKKIYLYFPKSETEKPIVYHLVKDFDLIVNIFRAKVTSEEEGYLSLEVTGTPENIDRATRTVAFNEESCVECLACIAACPFGACSSAF